MYPSHSDLRKLQSLPKSNEAFTHFKKGLEQLKLTRNAQEFGHLLDNTLIYIEFIFVNETQGKDARTHWRNEIYNIISSQIDRFLPQIHTQFKKETRKMNEFEKIGEWVDQNIFLHVPNPSDKFASIRDTTLFSIVKVNETSK